eukprot:7775831-Pyramimonas_sp.AAC.1
MEPQMMARYWLLPPSRLLQTFYLDDTYAITNDTYAVTNDTYAITNDTYAITNDTYAITNAGLRTARPSHATAPIRTSARATPARCCLRTLPRGGLVGARGGDGHLRQLAELGGRLRGRT